MWFQDQEVLGGYIAYLFPLCLEMGVAAVEPSVPSAACVR